MHRQLIQGEEILQMIEKVPTHYEAPLKKIEIVCCGEFVVGARPDKKALKEIDKYLATSVEVSGLHEDVVDLRDVASELIRRRYKRGLYYNTTDMRSYMPFLHLPSSMLNKYLNDEIVDEEMSEEEKDCKMEIVQTVADINVSDNSVKEGKMEFKFLV